MKDLKIAILVFFFLTVSTGVIYPIVLDRAINGIFPDQAHGSLIIMGGKIVGSRLLGQEFKRPDYFWGRPSAVGNEPMPSGGSNASPTSAAYLRHVEELRRSGRTGDLLFGSASGVDPDISPGSAFAQVERIASVRRIKDTELDRLVENHIRERTLGFLGERRVNVLELNLALDRLAR